MPLADRNILITPNRGAATEPTIRFTGGDVSSSATITLRVLNSGTVGTLSFEGNSGQLFSLSDSFAGTIFSVNDVSGIPSIEVLDTGEIRLAQYNGFVNILGTAAASSTNTGVLRVVGGAGIGGNLYVGGTIFGNIPGLVSGIATTATMANRWTIARTLTLAGDLGGNVTFDGSSNFTLTATIQADSVALGTDTTGIYIATGATSGFGLSGSANTEGSTFTVTANSTSANTVSTIVFRDGSGNFSAGTITAQSASITNITNSTSTTTGALVVTGGVGIGQDLRVGGTIFGNISGNAATVSTIRQTSTVTHFLTFVDSNNPGATAELIYTTSSFTVIPSSGNVGIGTNTPLAKLQVSDGAIMPAAGNSSSAGIQFPSDPGGGAGDTAWIRYFSRGGESMTLEIGTTNDADDHIVLAPSGNVGIGISVPTSKLHVTGDARISGITTVTNTTTATSTTTGALQVAGGAGIGQNVWIGGALNVAGASNLGTAGSGDVVLMGPVGSRFIFNAGGGAVRLTGETGATVAITSNGSLTNGLAISTTGDVSVRNTTQSTTTNSGALQVFGGVGIGGNLYVGGEIVAQKLTIQLTTVTTTLVQTDDIIQTYNTTNAVSTTTGALQVSGGAGIGRDLYVGGTIFGNITGSITTSSTVNTVQQTSSGSYFVTFVDTNTTVTNAKLLFTTSSVFINPSNGTLSATELNSLSDITLKTNIKPISNSLDILTQLNGVYFDWKFSGKSSSGLIAQDVEQALPELVNDVNGYKALNYNGLIGVLVEAVKTLTDKVVYLESIIKNSK